MVKANEAPAPMLTTCKLIIFSGWDYDIFSDTHLYMSIVGALKYVTLTRVIALSINKTCEFMVAPFTSHWSAVRRNLKYLGGTHTHGLVLAPSILDQKFSLMV